MTTLTESKSQQKGKIDLLGGILLALVLGSIMFICEGAYYGESEGPIICMFILGIIFTLLLFFHEKKSSTLTIPALYLFRNTSFLKATLIYVAATIIHLPILFIMPTYLAGHFSELPEDIAKQITMTDGMRCIENIHNVLKSSEILIGDVTRTLKQWGFLDAKGGTKNSSSYAAYKRLDTLKLKAHLAFQEINVADNPRFLKEPQPATENATTLSNTTILIATIIIIGLIIAYVVMGLGLEIGLVTLG